MEYRILGKTGLKVSFLSLGTLTLGPLQANLSISEGTDIIRYAISLGVNLIDTAELYETYEHIRQALSGISNDVLISSRSYAVTFEEMKHSVAKALRETGRDRIDLFMLHQQESELTLRGHSGALDYLLKARNDGLIRSAGISTHHIRAVEAAMKIDEIDFVFAPLNRTGLGIMDGTADDMAAKLEQASLLGKGILVMKPLGGGHHYREIDEAISYLRKFKFISSIVIGIQSADELVLDYNLMHGLPVDDLQRLRVQKKPRRLHIDDCQGCGECIKRCEFGALSIKQNITVVDRTKCVLCGYCASACPEFCIKVL